MGSAALLCGAVSGAGAIVYAACVAAGCRCNHVECSGPAAGLLLGVEFGGRSVPSCTRYSCACAAGCAKIARGAAACVEAAAIDAVLGAAPLAS